MTRSRTESEKLARQISDRKQLEVWKIFHKDHINDLVICKICGDEKPRKDFCSNYWNRMTCLNCIRNKTKKWRHENSFINNQISKKSFKKSANMISSHKNSPCQACGVEYPAYVMDFHHTNMLEKQTAIPRLYQKSIDRLNKELPKCILICANCHRDLTHKDKHKIPVFKNRKKREDVIDIPSMPGDATRTCSQCHQTKHENNFTLLKTGYRHSFCKSCLRKRNNEYSSVRRKNGKRQSSKEYIISQKDNKPCADCGRTFRYWMLDFDHRKGTNKIRNVNALQNNSLDKIKQEISKCDLLCVCCHRIRTFNIRKHKNEHIVELPTANLNVDINKIGIDISDPLEYKPLLNKYHYAKCGRAASIVYKAIFNEEIIAIIKFSPVVRKEVATSEGYSHVEVLELDRFMIIPGGNTKNLGSKILSLVIQNIKKTRPNVLALISFADPAQGHMGGLYRASNWEFLQTSAKSYVYYSNDGVEINKKTLYNTAKKRGLKEREYAEALSLSKIEIPGKHKFIYRLR